MTRYTIDYQTGVTEVVDGTLDKAKEVAVAGIAYTQENVIIKDGDGEEVTRSTWYGVKPEEDDAVLEIISEGFYQTWNDELA